MKCSQLEDPLLKQALQNFLTDHQLIGRDRETHFIVAFSGGRDSTALLQALAELRESHPLTLTAAYYWHPWRPLQQDMAVVAHHCKALQIQWVMLTPDLNLPKTEAAARQDRYQQLSQLAHDLSVTAVLTAHHQDDEVETLLFRIFRGTGIEGITGIPDVRSIQSDDAAPVTLARPLLHVSREVINQYITEQQLRYVDDPTNAETQLSRNLIRHEILPRIESGFPQVRQSLIKLSELLHGDLEIIEKKMDEVWQEVYVAESNHLDETRFAQLARSFQRRVVRRFFDRNRLEAGYQKVDEVIDFILGKKRNLDTPGLFSLSKDTFLALYRHKVTIEAPKKTEIAPVTVAIPGAVSHKDLRLTLSITPLTYEEQMAKIDFSKMKEDEIYVDLSRLASAELTLRGRQQGDKIRPLGMSTPMKLKKFLINRCIPRFERDSIPLLAMEDEVLWAVGVGLSDRIRVQNRPTHLIKLKKDNQS